MNVFVLLTFLVAPGVQACLQQSSKSLRHFHRYVGYQHKGGVSSLRRADKGNRAAKQRIK